MARFGEAHDVRLAAAVLDQLDEVILRLIEYPDVASGLEEQHRRLHFGAGGRIQYGPVELQRLAHPFERRAVGLVFAILATQLEVPAFTRFGSALVAFHREFRREARLPEHALLAEAESAQRADQHTGHAQRHAGGGGDHRGGEHRFVEQGGVSLQHGRANAAAHRMAEQVQRHAGCVLLADGFGEAGQIGHVALPVINPHHAAVVHVAHGLAVAAMLEYTHRVAGEQEVPDELVVLLGELGETVADDDGPAEGGGGALLVNRVEFGGVVAQVVQLARAAAGVHNAGQRLDPGRTFGGGRIEPALLAALFERGQHHVGHHFGVLVFVDHRHLHGSHLRTSLTPLTAQARRL